MWANNIIIFIIGVLFGGPLSFLVAFCVLEIMDKRAPRELSKEEWKAGVSSKR